MTKNKTKKTQKQNKTKPSNEPYFIQLFNKRILEHYSCLCNVLLRL